VEQLVTLAEFTGQVSGLATAGTVPMPGAPFHCGAAMEWTTPTPGPTEFAYSYDTAEAPAELPALWRCGCGFQLDSLVNLEYHYPANLAKAMA
jgi:hypothetical protein